MRPSARQRLRLTGGTELSFIAAGEKNRPAVLLLHGSPSSARMFREVIPGLSQAAYVIAPDLPGFGESDVLRSPSFPALAQAISELLDQLSIGSRFIYLHDYGAPVGLHIAMQAPERVLGLIVQNANAHRTGLGPQWDATQVPYWSQPTAENEAAATAHLTFEGTRATYTSGAPPDVVARMSPEIWEEDWRVMNLPGRMDTQRALISDYGKYVECFDAIARLSCASAATCADDLGKARSLLRTRRSRFLDAGTATDGSPRSRRRAQVARDARGRGLAAHARLHPTVPRRGCGLSGR